MRTNTVRTDRHTDRHTPMTTRPCGLRRAGNKTLSYDTYTNACKTHQHREYVGISQETNAYNPTLCTNTSLEQYTHTQWGEHSLGVYINVNRGCNTPSGGVNNSLHTDMCSINSTQHTNTHTRSQTSGRETPTSIHGRRRL